ncbi:MAG TPA: DsbC family protein [Burkholderiales bacterium]|nr:DsbC family protein [Burkholderiales bacterium]
MSRKLAVALLAVAGLAAGSARASEANIRKAFQARFPQASVESVARTPFAGIYEVVFDGQIAYTDEKLSFVLFGNLYDVRGGAERNLTRERSGQLAVQAIRKSLDHAFKRVRGNGRRVLYTFEDPNCPYCKKLHAELAKVNDVTVYTFLIPILGPESVEKARAIWCAKDRARAWNEAMEKGAVSEGSRNCEVPFEQTLQLSQRFGIRGTPTIYFADGSFVGGFIPADKIEEALKAAAR